MQQKLLMVFYPSSELVTDRILKHIGVNRRMDLKGITWAADIYEKFEAMCLEVEDAIYEDTIKYVENQAQKVGVGVKTFYTDVVQDLLPPSCIEISNEQAGVEDFCDSTARDSASSVRYDAIHRPLMPHGVLVGNTQSEEGLRMSTRGGGSRSSIDIRSPHPPKVSAESLMQDRNDSEEFPANATVCNSYDRGSPPAAISTHTREVVESVGEETIASYEGHFDIKVIEAESILEPTEKSRLEESCVMVEPDELDYVSQVSKEHKSSYKKKIYNVLSLNLKSRRKQDLFISDHEDSSDKNDDCDKRRLAAPNSCDFGWELEDFVHTLVFFSTGKACMKWKKELGDDLNVHAVACGRH